MYSEALRDCETFQAVRRPVPMVIPGRIQWMSDYSFTVQSI